MAARVSVVVQSEDEDAADARFGVTHRTSTLAAEHDLDGHDQHEEHELCYEDVHEEPSAAGGIHHMVQGVATDHHDGVYSHAMMDSLPVVKPTDGGMRPGRTKNKREKKGPVIKPQSWLCINVNGSSKVLQADKYKLTVKLGIQTRDLRLLDPHMSSTYPSAILCRDKSIVVNLEHIKAIITTDSLLVVNHEDEATRKFVEEVKQRLANPAVACSKAFASTGDLQRAAAANAPGHSGVFGIAGLPGGPLNTGTLSAQLPFELRALEVCLDELAAEFDLLTSELEASAYPALDSLATRVTSPHLERVRRIKNRLVRLTTRVETVREVLEKFLDDDEDMHDLNLTANQERESLRKEMDLDAPYTGDHGVARVSTKSIVSSLSTNSSVMESEVAEVEMLLEAYFMAFDNTFNRLTTLNEYIKDTEDLVNIKLDQHRNTLISTDLILTALTCSMAMITTIAGIFGMNLYSGLEETPDTFLQVTIASCVGALVLFAAFVTWAVRYRLLVFN